MSATKQITLWCDRGECPALIQLDEHRTAQARKQAWHEGWAQVGPSDYCPTHANQEPA